MGLEFDRPVGLKADESELLYISALHQTGELQLRQDASIRAEDIRFYLISRYGIDVSVEMVEEVILNNNSNFDLISLVSTLFVPTFMKLATPIEERRDVETICPHILKQVLDMILHDVTGDTEPKILNLSIVRDIFLKYGEDVASDDEQLEKILLAATGGREDVELNEESVLRALTHDLHVLEVQKEAKTSTNFMDVFGDDCHDCHGITMDHQGDGEDKKNGDDVRGKQVLIKRIATGKAIDFIAGTYSCKYQVICVWSFFVFTFMGYVYPAVTEVQQTLSSNCTRSTYTSLSSSWADNSVPFGCSIAKSILDWLLLFAAIVVTGFVVVWVGCIGYESEPTGSVFRRKLSRLLAIAILTVTLLAGPILTNGIGSDSVPSLFFLRIVAFILGVVTILLRLVREVHMKCFASEAFALGTAVQHESQIKRASALKIKTMQQNALGLFTPIDKKKSVIKQYYGQALANYTKHQDRVEFSGGFSWFSKRFWNGDIYIREGCWFSARFLGSIFTTFILATFILFTGIFLTRYAHSSWIPPSSLEMQVMDRLESVLIATASQSMVHNAVNKLVDRAISFLLDILSLFDGAGILRLDCFLLGSFLTDLCGKSSNSTFSDFACNLFIDTDKVCDALDQLYRPQQPIFAGLQNGTIDYFSETSFAFNTTFLREPFVSVVSNVARDNLVFQVNKLYPKERYMVVVPCVIATIVAVIASYSLTLIVLPSITSTSLKLRSGVIPTLTSKTFIDYRYEMNSITYISGCLFWGNLVASVLVGGLVGGFVFLCIWQVTIVWIQRLFALMIGIGLVILVRGLLSIFCRRTLYRGFYRIRPLTANSIALLNSCLNFAISTATVLIRMGKLILLACLYVGRIDTPFVADKVGEYGNGIIKLEGYNQWFVADLLAVEAHRHPYIETLGKIYLMKLKHGRKFMNSTGGKWRELFVIAMMPWLHKYRTKAKEGNKEEEEVFVDANEA